MTAKTKQWLAFACGIALALVIAGAVSAFRSGQPQGTQLAAGSAAPTPTPTASRSAVKLATKQTTAIDLQVVAVTEQDVLEDLRVVATVVPDESRISHIHTRIAGWVEKLYVGNTGEYLRAGQPIVDIFSQELFVSQVEYLTARTLGGPPSAVAESGRARLHFFGMSESDIKAIEKTGIPRRVVTLSAPHSGILAHRGIAAGTAVDPSTEIAVVLDLSRIWVLAEVPESAASGIKQGMLAELAFGANGKLRIPAKVEFIDPLLTEATRTLKVRFSMPNMQGELRPGMYGTAAFKASTRRALTVPRDALVDTGASQYVYVMTAPGVYQPRVVSVGARLKETVEIIDGLHAQDKVVVSGVFLLDSESRLRASGGQGAAHGGHGQAKAQPVEKPPASAHPAGGASHD